MTLWTSDQPVVRPIPKHRTTQTQHKRIRTPNTHAFSGIPSHDPSVQASEDSSCLRPRGYCDRQMMNLVIVNITVLSQHPTEGFRERRKETRIGALSRNCYFGFEILAAVTINNSIIWDIHGVITNRKCCRLRNCKLSLIQLTASNLTLWASKQKRPSSMPDETQEYPFAYVSNLRNEGGVVLNAMVQVMYLKSCIVCDTTPYSPLTTGRYIPEDRSRCDNLKS
jgi:hypothetical protein